jgi:ubiquinone/menaquinone biosynthesis C-methylase UbiE
MTREGSDAREIVERAREIFGRDLLRPGYAQIISDAEHLANLLKLCEIAPGKSYLDIGTGSGYIAFELAQQNPDVAVTGIDIIENVIAANSQKAHEIGCQNLSFITFGGTDYPFSDGAFYGVASRYAFHHFPIPELSAREIYRILEPGGFCVISDPMADPADDVDFVNAYAALRDDGHVRYYREAALVELFAGAGFTVDERFYSAITFPRPMDTRYDQLLARTEKHVPDLYQIRVENEQIYMTVQIMNIRFRKPAVQKG